MKIAQTISCFFLIVLWTGLSAQSCLPNGITITTQSQINNFNSNYPGCTMIGGTLKLNGVGITNLTGLSGIVEIGGSLIVDDCDALLNLNGLNNLESIGDSFYIANNSGLDNFLGLDELISIGGDVEITNNSGFLNCLGLEGLEYLPGNLTLRSITSLQGFNNLQEVSGFVFTYGVGGLSGLESLETVGSYCFFRNCNSNVTNLSGISNLVSIGGTFQVSENNNSISLVGLNPDLEIGGGLSLYGNNLLASLAGLENLTELGGSLSIENNNSLLDLNGLSALQSINGSIEIRNNPLLTELTGIDGVDPATITNLFLTGNNILTFCSTPNICEYLSNPGNPVSISNNDPGCNTRPEVEAGCVPPCNVSLTISASPTTICLNESSTLSAVASGGQTPYSFVWSTGQTGPSIVVTPVVTTTYHVTVTDDNACTSTEMVTVDVLQLPIVTIGSNSPVCQGTTLNLTASGGISYSWSGPNGFSSSAQNPTIGNAQPVNGGSYSVTVTGSNGCTAIASTSVTISLSPVVTAGSNSPICQGATINLTSSGGTSYIWSGPNGFSSSSQNPTIPNAQPVNGGSYSVIVTGSNGCSAATSTSVVINLAPTITAGSNSPVCPGSPINLTSSGGSSYSWTGPGGFTSNLQNPMIVNAQSSHAGSYTVIVTGANGCTSSAMTTVVVHPQPMGAAGSNSPVCQGMAINLSGSGGTSYSWTGPNNFTSNEQNPTIPNAQSTMSGSYSVMVTDGNGCTDVESTDVLVNTLPVVEPINTSPVCKGGDVDLLVGSGASFLWSGPAGFQTNEQNPTLYNIQLPQAGNYTVTVTDGNGCSASASTLVIVNQVTAIAAATNETCNNCNDGTAIVTASGGNSYEYLWSNGEVTQSIVDLAAGTYKVTVTGDNGCTATAQAVVNAFGCSTITLTTGVINAQCYGQEGQAWVNVAGGVPPYSYAWSNNETNDTISATAGTYEVVVTDADSCAAAVQVTIGEPEAIVVSVSTTGETCDGACDGKAVGMATGGILPYTWLWSNGADTSSVYNLCAGAYGVTVTDSLGCVDMIDSFVIAKGVSALPLILGDTIICPGETGVLNTQGGFSSYLWSTGETTPSINWAIEDVYSVRVTKGICSDSAEIETMISPEILLELVFDNDTLFANAMGGWPPLTYLWNTNEVSSYIIPQTNGTYTVVVSDSVGCAITDSMVVMINALVDTKTTSIKVYPNPVRDWLTVVLPDVQEEVQIEVISITGLRVLQENLPVGKNRIDVSGLLPGVYLLILKSGGGVSRAVFMKE